MPATGARRREPLNRAKVLRAGIALADAEGLDAVTMRRLAEDLGVVPMALYKHVADKDDLLDGMVDTLIADISAVPALQAEDWPRAVRETLTGARTVVTRHAWARRAIETRTERTPAVLAHMERVTQLFLAAGFTPDLTHHVMHLLGNRIWGFSPELFTRPEGTAHVAEATSSGRRAPSSGPRPRRRTTPEPDPADYPGILAIAADAQARLPGAVGCDEDYEFAFALDVLLDGVSRLHRARWTSQAGAGSGGGQWSS